jgi:DNA-binding transcriptional regulator GbsR (MarR family)
MVRFLKTGRDENFGSGERHRHYQGEWGLGAGRLSAESIMRGLRSFETFLRKRQEFLKSPFEHLSKLLNEQGNQHVCMDECDRAFVTYYQKVGRAYGMDELSSSIFALLFLNPEDISLEDLARETGYSLSSVSNKTRMLEMTGCITRVRKAGSKKVFFFAEKDIMKMTFQMMEKIGSVEVTAARSEIPAIISRLKTPDMSNDQKKKIKILQDYLKGLQKFDKLIQELKGSLSRT